VINNMQILSVISRLLDYPDESLFEHKADIVDLIQRSDLDASLREKLLQFVESKLSQNLLDWQSDYDALFERGRSLGLWLFEHVHGESRDRGQAMVDLSTKYKEAGLHISEHQLPDYIPMFLEFLSTQGQDAAREWLRDVEHILVLLQCRLERRDSDYAVLFEIMLAFGECRMNVDEVRAQVSGEKRDDSKKAIDKEWEEEEVTFGADSLDAATKNSTANGCGGSTRRPSESQRKDLDVPLNWVGFNEAKPILEGVAK